MPFVTRNYEPAIDGLRAVAVVAVLLFHAGVLGFSGGFIGVDVFFVISGFLITRNILSDLEQNKFTFKNFFIRRTRRIFPAMLFTMLLVGVCGAWILSPVHLERLGGSLVYASFGLSNIYFWQEAGYWDTMKDFKPLLHFWSLAVEEQFYLFWPAVLFWASFFLKIRSAACWVIAGLSFLSLIVAQYFLSVDSSAAFYLMPFRIFEFGLGASLLWIEPSLISVRLSILCDFLALCGLGAIALSVCLFSNTSPFPGLWALLPCIGAVSLIYVRHTKLCSTLLGNGLMVGVGKISYSLYLIHWPVFVFYKYTRLDAPTSLEIAMLMAVSVIAAILMYRYIEQPFRLTSQKKKIVFQPAQFFLVIGSLLFVLVLSAAHAWQNSGWAWRLAKQELYFTAEDVKRLRQESRAIEKERKASEFFKEHPAKFVILGDSYARDILNALEYNDVRYPVKRLKVKPGCLPLVGYPAVGIHPKIRTQKDAQECRDRFQKIIESGDLESAEIVMLGAHWYDYGVERLAPTIDEIKKRTDAQIIIFGHKMMYGGDVPTSATRYGKIDGLEAYINGGMRQDESLQLNEVMKHAVSEKDVIYVNPIDMACPHLDCQILTDDLKLTIIDDGHWSVEGATLFGQRLKGSQSVAAQMLFKYP
jgi:peptidoglycan/LPS O-acetylase OafA/YrhL